MATANSRAGFVAVTRERDRSVRQTTRGANAAESSGFFGVLLICVDAGIATIAAEGADGSEAASDLLGDAAAPGAMDIRASADRTLVRANLINQLHMVTRGGVLDPRAAELKTSPHHTQASKQSSAPEPGRTAQGLRNRANC